MKLNLLWKDKENNSYNIAKLSKEEGRYILEIQEENLKKAIKKGCLGIGNIGFLQTKYESKELFGFFKERIPSKDNPNIENILKEYNLKEYEEMELLKATRGIKVMDRYYIE